MTSTSTPPAQIRTADRQRMERAARRAHKKAENRAKFQRQQKIGELLALHIIPPPEAPSGRSAIEMLDEVREQTYALWRFAQAQVAELTPQEYWKVKTDANGNLLTEPHKWLQYEQALREELADLGLKLVGVDIDMRRVQIEEAKATMLTAYMVAVLDRLELTPEQKELLRPAMTDALPLLEGTAVDG